jgi:hypothetical protein
MFLVNDSQKDKSKTLFPSPAVFLGQVAAKGLHSHMQQEFQE